MLLRKPVLEYYLYLTMKAIGWIVLIYTGIFLLSAISSIIFMSNVNIGTINVNGSEGGTTFSGIEGMFAFAFLIICASDFKQELHFMFQHGVSRRSSYFGMLGTIVIASAASALIVFLAAIVFDVIASLLRAPIVTYTIFDTAYAGWRSTTNAAVGTLVNILFYWALLVMAGSIGYFFSIVFNRLEKFGRTILIGLGIAFVISLPLLNNLSNGRLAQFGLWLWGVFIGQGETANPFNAMGVFLAFAVLALIPSWVLIRRIKLKK
ncbi:MAG: hypothetical protein FWE12_04390 [Oscillospiraceae bacterium]|nr:hypothetical protein [Oscillospiraceae bacterium]